jgi:hypothetical protein
MKPIFALAFALLPLASAADYLGVLKAPSSTMQPTGLYSFATGPLAGLPPTTLAADGGLSLKLGYKYSRYFAVEGEFSDYARPADVFANPARLTSAFRSTGFAVDTVATLPLWGFSFYGRMGAYRGDRAFAGQPALWVGDNARQGTRWRYGLGVRYDITKSLGIRAQFERYSSLGLGAPFAGDGDTDQVSVGLSWRF